MFAPCGGIWRAYAFAPYPTGRRRIGFDAAIVPAGRRWGAFEAAIVPTGRRWIAFEVLIVSIKINS